MEKPIPPNPDTMTDEEFDKVLNQRGNNPLFFFTRMKKCITIYAVLFLQNCRSKRAFFIYLQILHFIYANKFKTKGTRRRTGKA